jgi:hypothetical protein
MRAQVWKKLKSVFRPDQSPTMTTLFSPPNPEDERRQIRFGLLEGQGWIADDFDAPLPDEILAQFEGRDDPPF